MSSKVDHPKHYNTGKFEVIDVIEDWGLNFHLGNAVKYIARAEHKGNAEEDIEKAIWYLKRELERRSSPNIDYTPGVCAKHLVEKGPEGCTLCWIERGGNISGGVSNV